MTRVLEKILSRDFADLAGAEVRGTIPLTEAVLNEAANHAIARQGGRIKRVDLQVGTENHLEVGVQVSVGPFSKWFRPELVVGQRLLPGSQTLVISLASSKYAGVIWLVELFAKQMVPEGVTIRGGDVFIDLSGLPHTRHLRSLDITTRRGTLFIAFELRIE